MKHISARHRRPERCAEAPIAVRRRNRFDALRAHRMRLAQTAQHTFHTVLTTLGFTEDGADSLSPPTYHDLSDAIRRSSEGTSFYPHQSPFLAGWEKGPSLSVRADTANPSNLHIPSSIPDTAPESGSPTLSPHTDNTSTQFDFVSTATLAAARGIWKSELAAGRSGSGIGVLNSASPKKAGAASLSGGDTQEECLIRQSTLLSSQNSDAGAQFYATHRVESDGSGLHHHAMLFSPGVVVFKDERGRCTTPFPIDVVSSVPVNLSTVHAKFNVDAQDLDKGVRSVLKERMARVLRLFEERGDRILILGAFGVGQFCNSPDMIGELWADLLHARGAKFQGVFEKIVFAVPGKHLLTFENAFQSRVLEAELLADS